MDRTLEKLQLLGETVPFFGEFARWAGEVLTANIEPGQPPYTQLQAECLARVFNGNVYTAPAFQQSLVLDEQGHTQGEAQRCVDWLKDWINTTFDQVAALQPLE